ncbi:hypothetical protein BT93_E1485 [Corymbia citriodora subsp. variegata]|nr:hypothetical protein BT93_E1485 [Corymbia citriodora subsp. variegata]
MTISNFCKPRSLISNTKGCRRDLSQTKARARTHTHHTIGGRGRANTGPPHLSRRKCAPFWVVLHSPSCCPLGGAAHRLLPPRRGAYPTATARCGQHGNPPFAPLSPHAVSPTLKHSTSLCFALAR